MVKKESHSFKVNLKNKLFDPDKGLKVEKTLIFKKPQFH